MIVTEEDNLQLTLLMPSNVNSTITKLIGETAHQFIVATAIGDWSAFIAKGETADYTSELRSHGKIFEEALCKRLKPKNIG